MLITMGKAFNKLSNLLRGHKLFKQKMVTIAFNNIWVSNSSSNIFINKNSPCITSSSLFQFILINNPGMFNKKVNKPTSRLLMGDSSPFKVVNNSS